MVADVRHFGLAKEPNAEAFIAWGPVKANQALVVRSKGNHPTDLVAAIRREVGELFPGAPVYRVATGDEIVLASYADRRLWTVLIGTFALLALGLGGLGFYGVVAHSVSSRDREIGIRMALGALPRAILRLIVRQSLRPVVVGIVVGVGMAAGATRWLESQLYQVSTHDPSAFGWGVVALLASAVAVCAVPALRASRIDPAVAVRGEG